METIHNFVQLHAIAFSALILFLVYILIIIEKMPKVTIAIIGATITIALGLVAQDKGFRTNLDPDYYINFIDFNVIFLLISMMIIVDITAKSGVFNWIANELLKFTKGKPKLVLLSLGLFTAFLSAFLDNVTTVILILPVTFVIAKELDLDPIPLLITEVLASNIGGTATLIGDPPNIIIGSAAGFSFLDFVLELTGIITLILFTSLGILIYWFRNELKTKRANRVKIKYIDNSKTITNYPLMLRGTITLVFVILGFIMHDYIHIQTCVVALAGASFLLIFEKPKQIFKEIEWNTIIFFIGLFIIIGGLEASGGIGLMAKWLLDVTQGSQSASAMIILWASGILSGIIDNIPYTVTMAPMLGHIQSTMGSDYTHPLWWCLSLGACLGGNFTIIGAAANVIVSEAAANAGHKISFTRFMKYGALITLIALILSSIYIYARFLID